MKKTLVQAATPAILATVALALSLSFPVKTDSLILGYAAVATLGLIGSMEYRIKWNWLFNR